jgi:hypothetical protein
MNPQSIQQYFEYEERAELRRQALKRFYRESASALSRSDPGVLSENYPASL